MSIYGISLTNIPEMRSIINFNRLSYSISESLRRLETGQRIISGKDDPSGIISRDIMRADIRGIQSAQKTTMMANELLATAESALSNVSRMLIGDINNRDDNGLIGLIYDTTLPSDMKKQQINDILNMIDGVARTTNYNGKRMLDGSMGYRTTGVDGSKLGNVTVSRAAFDTAKGQTVSLSVLEQARKGMLEVDIDWEKDLDIVLTGVSGETVAIQFLAGYTTEEILDTINDETERTGVRAWKNGTSIFFETLDVGSNQTLSVTGKNGPRRADKIDVSDSGRDVLVKINGTQVQGNGREIQYTSGELEMSATIARTFAVGAQTQFNVEGGALFQLGKDVQTSMQYRMYIPSMTVSNLGGDSGRLNELRTIDLETDEGKARAYAIVNEAVNLVAQQRGTIGAVQKHVLDANATNLDIQLEKISEAEGLLSNVDMAMESAWLARAELLAQSAMSSILYSRSFNQFILNALL